MATSPPQTYRLPDLFPHCHYRASFNPHHKAAAAASSKWVLSHKVFKGKKLDFFLDGGSELLCAWVYPYAGFEQLRTCMDFVNLLFTVDEISDDQNGKDAMATGEIVLKTMADDNYDDGSILCRMTKDFKQRFAPYAGPVTFARFLKHTEGYVRGFGREAELREQGEVLDVDSYNVLRRENSAVRYCLALVGYILGLDLPDEIYEHPVYVEMHLAAVDMITWSNDVYSYNMEQAMGHFGNNILTVLQRSMNTDLQGASDYVEVHFKELAAKFEDAKSRLPSFGEEMDAIVDKYIMATECWIIGNMEWSFDTRRYFGSDGPKIRETLIVELYPPRNEEEWHE